MWAHPATSAHTTEPVTTIAGHPDWSTKDAADGFHPGDTFCIDVRTAPDLSGELTIGPNGRVTPPQLSAVMAGVKEVRAWTIHVGDTAPQAAGVACMVHRLPGWHYHHDRVCFLLLHNADLVGINLEIL